MSEPSSTLAEFSRSIWAKVLGVLTIVMMLLGIYVEIITAWRATNEAIKAAADAAVAKQLAGAQTQKLSEEARVAKELNDAQTQKLKAEANVAKDINQAQLGRAKAEECSAKMKAILDTQPLDKAFAAGDALQRECSGYIIQTPARPAAEAEDSNLITSIDLINFYRWLAPSCKWSVPPSFDVVDRYIANNNPSEYAAGRTKAQQSITKYATEREKSGVPEAMGCELMRPIFDKHAGQLDGLAATVRQRLGGDTRDLGDYATAYKQTAPTRSVTLPTPAEPSVPVAPPVSVAPPLIIPDSDKRRLTLYDLKTLSPTELRIARNEIFARRGRYFQDEELKARFEQYNWYKPYTWDPVLSPIEKENVKILTQAERNG